MTAPAMAPLFALFFEDSPSTAAPDEVDSDAGLALSAVARVEDAAELCDLEELELEVEVDELLELEDKEIEDDEDITDVVEEIALLLEADDVVLAAAEEDQTPGGGGPTPIGGAYPGYGHPELAD